jgi:hypothetical protein
MFSKTKKNIVTGISEIEKRICNLENPYKFQVGDKVYVKQMEWEKKMHVTKFGIIVKTDHVYKDSNYVLDHIAFLRDYKPDPVYKRYNEYQVYFDIDKKTQTFDEYEIYKQ